MSKFNKTINKIANTINKAGGASYTRDDFRQELVTVILNTMLNGNTYYETETDRLKRIESLIEDNIENAEFMAKAMVYTRNEGNLRSISHYMAPLLAEKSKGTTFMKSALYKTMIRPDDATEMIALWNIRNENKMIPNAIRKATKQALETKWDAYQLKKYFGTGSVKVSNLVQIAHPKPKDEAQRVVFRQVLEGALPAIQTAQTVNAAGKGGDRAQNYAVMLSERKLGYMAALKNIKNILESGANNEIIEMLCNLLENEKAVAKSRVLPFRFTQAYNEIDALKGDRIKIKKVLKAIEKGFMLSAKNLPIVDEGEKVALLLDESGSMGWGGGINDTQPFTIGKTLMASMLTGLDKDMAIGYLWADRAREVSIDMSPMQFIKNTRTHGGGTDVWAAMSELIDTGTFVDKIVIITDMQMYNVSGRGREFKDMVKAYRKINPNVKVLFWNVAGYSGGTPIKLDHGILEVAGFSDKMLDVIPKMWKDKSALIKEIEQISL